MSVKLTLPQATILDSLSRGPMHGIKRTPPVNVLVSKGLAKLTGSTLTITEAGMRFRYGPVVQTDPRDAEDVA